jgi:hypothetical protein
MDSFFKNIGLYDHLNFNIEMNKSEFVESFKKITYETNTSFISLIPDHGIPTRYEYRGLISADNFIIKRRKHLFDINIYRSIIKGNIVEEKNKTVIKIEFTPFIYPLIASIIGIFLFLFIASQEIQNNENYFLFVITILITIIQYFILKRNIKRDKYDFERELNFIVQKNKQFKSY